MSAAIEAYLEQLTHWLTVESGTRDAILEEVRGHLEASTVQLEASGVARGDAATQSIAAFGSPQAVAARFNTVHPQAWHLRQIGIGLVWGIVITWAIWTLVAFPAETLPTISRFNPFSQMSAAQLLFRATPFSFGLYQAIGEGGSWWALPAFLALYSITPFVWGARAQQSWRPGFAFGLGVVVGFPWLLPGLFYQQAVSGILGGLVFVVGTWLLLPYAIAVSWLGGRVAHIAAAPSHRSRPRPIISAMQRAFASALRRRIVGMTLAGCLGILLLGVNVWSWAHFVAATMPLPLSQQLSTAQTTVTFTIRQPTYLPSGMRLVSVETTEPGTLPSIGLDYQDARGVQLFINEESARFVPSLYTPPNYEVNQGSGGEYSPVWWLGNDMHAVHMTSLLWTQGGVDYAINAQTKDTDVPLSVETLKHVAESL